MSDVRLSKYKFGFSGRFNCNLSIGVNGKGSIKYSV
jgi:hypothetical protein